jgi:hypothetical protein
MKTVIAADLHLQRKPGMWAGRAEIAGDDVWSLEQIVDLTCKYQANLMLLGDVFDTITNLPRPIVAAQQALGPLATEGRVRHLQGQHELAVGAHYANSPWLSVVPGTKHIGDGAPFEFHGMKACGLDYFPVAFEALNFSKIPDDVEVLFMHGTVDLAFPTAFHFSAESLKKFTKLQYVFAGDYHQAIELKAGKVSILYTGSTWQISANEPRDKSVILVEGEGTKLKVGRVQLATRTIVKLSELYTEDGKFEPAPFAERPLLPKELQTPVILIDLPTDGPTMEKLAELGHLYTTSAANPDVPTQAVIDMEGTLTNSEILQRFVDKEKKPGEFAFTLDIIENPVSDAVTRLKEKFGIKDADRTVQADGAVDINLENSDAAEEDEEEVLA